MCVLSVILDSRTDDWIRRYWPPQPPFPTPLPKTPPEPFVPFPTQQEIDEFRRLLERAKEYDKKMNQPDCETEEKKKRLIELAKSFGDNIAKQIELLLNDINKVTA